MDVFPVPCLNDNFAYLLLCPETGDSAVVDPAEAAPVERELDNEGKRLEQEQHA